MMRFLHVGCGHKRKDHTTRGFNSPEWKEIRLDIDPDVRPDIVGSLVDMSAVADCSVQAVFSSHSIEHLYPQKVRERPSVPVMPLYFSMLGLVLCDFRTAGEYHS